MQAVHNISFVNFVPLLESPTPTGSVPSLYIIVRS